MGKKYFYRSDGKDLEILHEPYCPICGQPIPKCYDYCYNCKDDPDKEDPLLRVRSFGKYKRFEEYPDDILSAEILKFKTDPSFCDLLSECLFYAVDNMYPFLKKIGCIVPVMRSTSSTFNQSKLLAEKLSERYNIPLVDCLYIKESYPSIHNIPTRIEREMVIRGKIGCEEPFYDETVLLIDDICTTMATKKECARVLSKNGAVQVWALVLGRTVSRYHMEILRQYNGN